MRFECTRPQRGSRGLERDAAYIKSNYLVVIAVVCGLWLVLQHRVPTAQGQGRCAERISRRRCRKMGINESIERHLLCGSVDRDMAEANL